MAKRPRRPERPAPYAVTDASPCPCGLPAAYGDCCGRFHRGTGAAPATAESLMRSRYSAFAVHDGAYLLRTWAPATRPQRLDPEPGTRWTGLDILDTTQGSPFHTTGTVTFRAHWTRHGTPGVLHERSRFERHEGAWVYLDGTFDEPGAR